MNIVRPDDFFRGGVPCNASGVWNVNGMEPDASPEEFVLDLEVTVREAQDISAATDRVYESVLKAMTESTFKEFPALKNMSAEQFRQFGEKLSGLSFDCATNAADFAFAAEQEE